VKSKNSARRGRDLNLIGRKSRRCVQTTDGKKGNSTQVREVLGWGVGVFPKKQTVVTPEENPVKKKN